MDGDGFKNRKRRSKLLSNTLNQKLDSQRLFLIRSCPSNNLGKSVFSYFLI